TLTQALRLPRTPTWIGRPRPRPDIGPGHPASGAREVGEHESAVLSEHEPRAVGDLPRVTVEGGEDARVAAVEGHGGRPGDGGSGLSGSTDDLVHLGAGPDVVGESDAAEAGGAVVIDPAVGGELLAT